MADIDAYWEESNGSLLVFFGACVCDEAPFYALGRGEIFFVFEVFQFSQLGLSLTDHVVVYTHVGPRRNGSMDS